MPHPRFACIRLSIIAAALATTSAHAEITLALRGGTTPYPGTTTPITAEIRSATLHAGGVLLVTRTTATASSRYSLLQHKNNALTVLLHETGGFPGGGDILGISVASDGNVAYVIPSRASGATTATHDALLRFENGAPTTLVPNSDALMTKGTLPSTGFASPTAAAGRAAFAGRIGQFSHYLFRYQGNTHTLVAQESVTPQPGTTGRFGSLALPRLSPDGTRLFFFGTNGQASNNAAYRSGYYVEQAGAISRVIDDQTDIPGATVKFSTSVQTAFYFSPDGAHTVIHGGGDINTSTGLPRRSGLYRYANSNLTTAVDTTTTVGGQPITFSGEDVVVSNDGTIYFIGAASNRNHIYRARANGQVELFFRGDGPEVQSISRLWLHGSDLFCNGFTPSFQRILARVPLSTGAVAIALNFDTNPTFTGVIVKSVDSLQFANGQVLLQLPGNIYYAAESDIGASSSGGGNGGGGGGTGGGGAASNAGRLGNMSIRTNAGTGDNTLIVGLAVGGPGTSGTKPILIRGVGPTLAAFNLSGTLTDPVMTVFQGSTQVDQNDDWTGNFNFSSVGAFAFSGTAPRDAAIYSASTSAGSYSIQIAGKNNGTGLALAEIYDATPSANFAATTPRLVNVSARTQVGTGDNILIAGFAVSGSSSVRVLIRAVGPTLGAAPFNVGGTLADPKLEIYSGATKTIENDNWAGTAELKAAFTSVAAFAFSADNSRDAALVATLQPGSYTAQISGVGNTAGVALVELYELP